MIVAALAVVSAQSFLLFHSLAELFAIVIGSSVFLIAWNSRGIAPNNFLLAIGIGYLAVSVVDLLHLLAFPGLNVLGDGRGLSSQLWLASRYLEAATLVAAPLFLRRRVSPPVLFTAFGAATVTLLWLIFSGYFPLTVEGDHLTLFKSASEVAISLLFVVAAGLFWRMREDVGRTVFHLIVASIAVRVASELSLVVYGDPHGPANFVGHVLKVAASYLLYKALIEQQLMRPYATLFRDLKARETELRGALDELESFSYSVSHDLRAPLTAVMGYGELLQHEFSDTPEDHRAEYVQHLVKATRRMAEIIDDLLRLGGLSRGEMELAPVDVSALCRSVIEALRKSEPDRKVETSIEPDLHAQADPRLLRSAFENLIGNAWKFTAKVPEPRIDIGLKADGKAAPSLFVRDNGAGFDPAKAGTLFNPFTRLHSDSEFKGTGIGLAIVQRIIQRHGGKVWAEGEPGKGATFYVQLPHLSAERPSGHK